MVEIISILADSYQESTYTYCARALCNLACAEGARLRVATEGGKSLEHPLTQPQCIHCLPLTSFVLLVPHLSRHAGIVDDRHGPFR